MAKPIPGFDPRQKMLLPDFEIAHKWDTDLKDVELHHHDFYEVDLITRKLGLSLSPTATNISFTES